jgi:hypothetical protein
MPAVRCYVMRSGRLVPLDGGTPILPSPGGGSGSPPPTPGGTGMLQGCSVSTGRPHFDAIEPAAGPYSCCRTYNSGGFAANWAADVAGPDVGVRASVYSAKPSLSAMASGALDAQVTAFIRSIPDSHVAHVTIWHEPDVKLRNSTPTAPFDVALWRSAFQRFCELVKAVGKPHVYTNLILTNWSLIGGVSTGLPDEFWVGPTGSDRLIDVVGWDAYMLHNTVTSGAHEFGPIVDYCDSKGAAWAIGELGIRAAVTDISAGATWMHTQADYAVANGAGPHGSAAYLCWFDFTASAPNIPVPSGNSTFTAASAAIAAQYHTPYTAFVL